MGKRAFVSLNQPVEDAAAEQFELMKDGYAVVGSYGDDFDIGNILEYAKGEDSEEVMIRHWEHTKYCIERKGIR
jgi:hypothetical protein